MLAEFYGLTQDPFRLSPDPKFCYRHANFAKAKAYMQYALHQGEGFVMVTGQPGTGKTLLIEDLLADPQTAKVAKAHIRSTQVGAEDLLRLVAGAFGLEARNSSKSTILLNLRAVLLRQLQSGHNSLVIVDEAQNLPYESIEELRMITNLQEASRPLLQVFLVGQDSLRAMVSEPRMEQLRQRILAASRMEPLKLEQTRAYIEHRLACAGWKGRPSLSGESVWLLHTATGGIPRLINSFAGRLLLHGAVEERDSLEADDARVVIHELQDELPLGGELPVEIPPLVSTESDEAVEIGHLAIRMATPAPRAEGASAPDPAQLETQEERSVDAASILSEAPLEESRAVPTPEAADGPGRVGPEPALPLGGHTPAPAGPSPFAPPPSEPAAAARSKVHQGRPSWSQPDPVVPPAPQLLIDSDRDGPEAQPSDRGPSPETNEPIGAGAAQGGRGSGASPNAGRRTWIWGAVAGAGALAVLGAVALFAFPPHSLQSVRSLFEPAANKAEAVGRDAPQASTAEPGGVDGQTPAASSGSEGPRPPSGNSSGKGETKTAARLSPVTGSPKTTPSDAGDVRPDSKAAPFPPAPGSGSGAVAASSPVPQAQPQTPAVAPPPSVDQGGRATAARPAESPPHAQAEVKTEGEGEEKTAAVAEAPPARKAAAAGAVEPGTPDGQGAIVPGTSAAALPPKEHIPVPPPGTVIAAVKTVPAKSPEPSPDRSAAANLAGRLRLLGLNPELEGKRGLRVDLGKELPFDRNSAEVPQNARALVTGIAEAIAVNPELAVKVVGHTDSSGAKDYNDWLSLQRAKAVATILVAGGVPADAITTQGLGSGEPLPGAAHGDASEGAANRRVELVIRERRN